MMHRVVKVTALPQYRLHVEFDDGVAGIVEIFPRLSGPVFAPLRDVAVFRRVTIDEGSGAVCWPDGPDLAPDAMYDRLSGKQMFGPEAEDAEMGTMQGAPPPNH
ncbi:MAG TPA: DUF2442 domain-containing protein [Stellaceae bacterium]|nr:DUF2442 domain-containing protein [Stellaceae bacterium]